MSSLLRGLERLQSRLDTADTGSDSDSDSVGGGAGDGPDEAFAYQLRQVCRDLRLLSGAERAAEEGTYSGGSWSYSDDDDSVDYSPRQGAEWALSPDSVLPVMPGRSTDAVPPLSLHGDHSAVMGSKRPQRPSLHKREDMYRAQLAQENAQEQHAKRPPSRLRAKAWRTPVTRPRAGAKPISPTTRESIPPHARLGSLAAPASGIDSGTLSYADALTQQSLQRLRSRTTQLGLFSPRRLWGEAAHVEAERRGAVV
mmetsp:Transcript_34255/g.85746  ORF Transcript_34255/g.85746 Transcript_34255/m.85746 type:complete len:255 (+) Transcript_34255:507-1271(+)